jgi:hypothetical protein
MKFIATKTAEQLDLQALPRVRERLVGQRTGIVNQIRAFLTDARVARARHGSSATTSRSCAEQQLILQCYRRRHRQRRSRFMWGDATGRQRGIFLVVASVHFVLVLWPAVAQPACSIQGDRYGANSYLYDIFMHPGTSCIEYFNAMAVVVRGGNSAPACGSWSLTTGRPGFQYTSYNIPCFDWLVVRIQMPDQGLWDYFYSISVYPGGDPLPPQ